MVWGEEALTLRRGEYVLGRGRDCDVVLDHPLISRHHAKIVVEPARVVIEDLVSANGVYVNDLRVARSQSLADGDRILLATRELSIFAAPRNEREQPREGPEARLSGGVSFAAPTGRADPFQVVGPMADRFLASGLFVEAEHVLSDHLNKLLDGARAALTVPAEVCATASLYAMKLAKSTRSGRWIDYAVELHMRTRRVMSQAVIDEFLYALTAGVEVDVERFRYYLEVLRGMTSGMTRAELELINRLACLNLPRSRGSGYLRPS